MSKTSSGSGEQSEIAAATTAAGFGGGDFLEPEAGTSAKSAKNTNKCIRLKLELFETDSNKYPEFNYTRLLHVERKKTKRLRANDDDAVARIAKELEAKYGNSYIRGRGRRKKYDYCDIGMGYDESDPFIDNTEPYDEVIPEEVDTLNGGFYINYGVLEFKNVTKKSYTNRTDEINKMPERSRKLMKYSSTESSSGVDDEDDDDDEGEVDDDDEEEGDDEGEDGSDSESLEDGDIEYRKKYKDKDKEDKRPKSSALADKPKVTIKMKTNKKLDGTSPSSSNLPRPIAVENSDMDEQVAVKDMLKAKRDKGSHNGELKCSTDVESHSGNDSTDSATEQDRAEKLNKGNNCINNLRTGDTILPTSLDAETLSLINQFKDAFKSRNMCNKEFFFDDKLTGLLVKVYEALLCSDRNARNKVFAHLEYQLQLPKYFILRKAKAIRSMEERTKTRNALDKLRKAVAEAMPKAIEIADANADVDPQKKFQWNKELRQLLYEVYQARWTSYTVLGKRKDSLEEFINGYLKKKVVNLWPKGCMHYEQLQHEIQSNNTNVKDETKTKTAVGHLNPILEDSRSCANSETSSSSNSLKRKFKEPPTGQNAKHPKVLKTTGTEPQDVLLTSAQAATLARVLD